jgi:hypothetical protein
MGDKVPESTDVLLTLADDLVTALALLAAAIGGEDQPAAFSAAWIDDPVMELSDPAFSSAVVWVTDFAEDLNPHADQPLQECEEFQLLVTLQRKVGEGEERATVCRAMSDLAAQIGRGCRAMDLGAICYRVQRTRAREFQAWHELRFWRAELVTYWRRAEED